MALKDKEYTGEEGNRLTALEIKAEPGFYGVEEMLELDWNL